MRTRLAALFAFCAACAPASAGGSVSFEDIYLAIFADSFKVGGTKELQDAIDKELMAQNLKVDDVECVGLRLGKEWTQLSGERIGPYDCRFGDKKLTIWAKRTTFRMGTKIISAFDAELPRNASGFSESVFDFSWNEEE